VFLFSFTPLTFNAHNSHFLFNLSVLKCYKSTTLWSTNHLWTIKSIEWLSKTFFGCLVIVFQVFSGFSFPPFNPLLWRVTSDSFLNLFQPLNFLCAQIVVATIPLWAWNSKEHPPEIHRPLSKSVQWPAWLP